MVFTADISNSGITLAVFTEKGELIFDRIYQQTKAEAQMNTLYC